MCAIYVQLYMYNVRYQCTIVFMYNVQLYMYNVHTVNVQLFYVQCALSMYNCICTMCVINVQL